MELVEEKLGEITALVRTGKTPPSKILEYYNGDVNWYGPGDLDSTPFLRASKRTITQKALIEKKANLIPARSVLIGCIGDIGKLGMISEIATSNQQITAVKPNDKVDYRFLYYWLKANKEQLKSRASNAILRILNNKSLLSIKIQYPKLLNDQKRIAQVLSDCEELIARRKESNELLDELVKSTFLEMFGDPVVNPKNFELVPFEKLGTIDRGVSKHRPRNAPELLGGEHPLIQTGDVSNAGTYITKYTQTYSDIGLSQSKKWPIGTLCITIAANIAKTGILTFEACFPDSVVGFVVNENSNNLFVHSLFSFLQRILEKNAPAAAQKNINLNILRNLKVPKPPIELQTQFANIFEKIEETKNIYYSHLTQLEKLYARLSQDAFKGDLDLGGVVLREEFIEKDKNDDEIEAVEKNKNESMDEKRIKPHITEMSLDDFYNIPDEIVEEYGSIENVLEDWEFILLKSFHKRPIEINELRKIYTNISPTKGNSFDLDRWVAFLFAMLSDKKSRLSQHFNQDTKELDLLINEIKKS